MPPAAAGECTASSFTELTADGKTAIATIHDPVLAARFCKFVLLLHGDGQWEYGSAEDLLNPSTLERLYKTPFESFQNDGRTVLLPA